MGMDQALWEAVDRDNEAETRRLLESGASPNARAPDGMPCLFAPAARGEIGVLRALLEGGADPLLERLGDHALSLAIKNGGGESTRAILGSLPKSVGFERAFAAMKVKKRPVPGAGVEPSASFLFASALEIAVWGDQWGLEKDWGRWSEILWAAEHWASVAGSCPSLGLGDWREAKELSAFVESRRVAEDLRRAAGAPGGESAAKRKEL